VLEVKPAVLDAGLSLVPRGAPRRQGRTIAAARDAILGESLVPTRKGSIMRYTFTPKPPKVAAATSTNASRPALTGAWLDTEAGELRATDSYIAVRMPVSIDSGDADGWVTADTLERSRKRDGGGIACNGSASVYTLPYGGEEPSVEATEALTVGTFPRPNLGQNPNLPSLWPVERDGFTVGINAGFLKRLAEALGAKDDVVHLTFQQGDDYGSNPLRAILVTTPDGSTERGDGRTGLAHPEGLIMPVGVR